MKIRLTMVAAAALTTLAPCLALAQSSVTVYGLIDATARYATNASAGGGHQYSVGDGAWNGSRLGFKGNEDLGSGMKASFALEMGIDPSTGVLQQATGSPNYGQAATTGGRVFGREAWVGLSSKDFGGIQLGRQYTLAHTLSGRFQPFANPNQDSLSFFSGHHVTRQDNMVKYTYSTNSLTAMASVTASEGNGKAWSIGGGYTAGPIDVVAYTEDMDSFNGAETRKIRGIGGAYAITDSLKAYAGYMKRTQRVSLQKNDVLETSLSWYATPAWQLTALYSQDKETNVGAGTRKLYMLAANYYWSKRTDTYVELDQTRVSGAYPLPSFMATRNNQNGVSFGIRHRF